MQCQWYHKIRNIHINIFNCDQMEDMFKITSTDKAIYAYLYTTNALSLYEYYQEL